MKTLSELEEEAIRERLIKWNFNVRATARSLGISEKGLRIRMKKLGIKGGREKRRCDIETFKDEDGECVRGARLTAKERDDWCNRDRY